MSAPSPRGVVSSTAMVVGAGTRLPAGPISVGPVRDGLDDPLASVEDDKVAAMLLQVVAGGQSGLAATDNDGVITEGRVTHGTFSLQFIN